MMDYTDRFCRYFLRLITRRTLLYTEMVTTGALIHGDRARFLRFDEAEHPVALQLGGSNPGELAICARFAEEAGYDEINLNCGCPSSRVQSGNFGACLMNEPALVADCISAMVDTVALPITVKNRIGVDQQDSWTFLTDFVGKVSEAGCRTFIVHARKAWLQGLSPKQNREIPPLDYERVYRLKQAFPHLEIVVNGQIRSLDDVETHLGRTDGAMIGREAYHNPFFLADADARIFGDIQTPLTRLEVLQHFGEFVARQLSEGVQLSHMTRHILGLFQGMPGARRFRRYISENAHKKGANTQVLYDALAVMTEYVS